jgi:UDP-2,3-diacylglucosamine hydrolase
MTFADRPTDCREPQRIGLLAGWGRFPLVVASALQREGHEVYCLGVKDHADPQLAQFCNRFDWIGLGQLGRAIRFYRRYDVSHATMAGKVHKVRLFRRSAWLSHFPDWTGLKAYFPHFVTTRGDRKDDTLLALIVHTFARGGITFQPATDYAPELLVKTGCLTDRRPSAAQQKDIEFGWNIAKEMGRLDIGQSIAIKDRAVLAVEAIEGTDQCVRRAGALCQAGGFTVVKVAKPQQDMRFDVPTVGIGTLESMHAAGGRVLAIEAGRTIVIDQAQIVRYANDHGIIVVAIEQADVASISPLQQAG